MVHESTAFWSNTSYLSSLDCSRYHLHGAYFSEGTRVGVQAINIALVRGKLYTTKEALMLTLVYFTIDGDIIKLFFECFGSVQAI